MDSDIIAMMNKIKNETNSYTSKDDMQNLELADDTDEFDDIPDSAGLNGVDEEPQGIIGEIDFNTEINRRNHEMNDSSEISIDDLIDNEEPEWDSIASDYSNKSGSYFEKNINKPREEIPVFDRDNQVFEDDDLKPNINTKIISYIVLIVIITVVLVVVGKKLKSRNSETKVSQATEQQVGEKVKEDKVITKAEEITKSKEVVSSILSTTTLEVSKQKYKDHIYVNKFLVFNGETIVPTFMGVAEEADKEVQFPVSVTDYNKYINGVRIMITFNAVKYEDTTYITDVKIEKESESKEE